MIKKTNPFKLLINKNKDVNNTSLLPTIIFAVSVVAIICLLIIYSPGIIFGISFLFSAVACISSYCVLLKRIRYKGEMALLTICLFVLCIIYCVFTVDHISSATNTGLMLMITMLCIAICKIDKKETRVVKIKGQKIIIQTVPFGYNEYTDVIKLTEKTPILQIYNKKTLVRELCLDTKDEEDFLQKFFHVSVRLSTNRMFTDSYTFVQAAQIDGFISDTKKSRKMTNSDIAYRFEVIILNATSDKVIEFNQSLDGQDLQAKSLRYPGYITPGNVRLVGYCRHCEKSFTFMGYNFPHMQADAVYSDDGLDVMALYDKDIDKDTWSCEKDGKTFRYYNSFRCPHCGEPYIDYTKFKDLKVFGILGCSLLGKNPYTD